MSLRLPGGFRTRPEWWGQSKDLTFDAFREWCNYRYERKGTVLDARALSLMYDAWSEALHRTGASDDTDWDDPSIPLEDY